MRALIAAGHADRAAPGPPAGSSAPALAVGGGSRARKKEKKKETKAEARKAVALAGGAAGAPLWCRASSSGPRPSASACAARSAPLSRKPPRAVRPSPADFHPVASPIHWSWPTQRSRVAQLNALKSLRGSLLFL